MFGMRRVPFIKDDDRAAFARGFRRNVWFCFRWEGWHDASDLLRHGGVACSIRNQIEQGKAFVVLDRGLSKRLQAVVPVAKLRQDLFKCRGNENMTGVAAVHDTLRS